MSATDWTHRRALIATAGLGVGLIGRGVVQRRYEADLHGKVALITGGSRGLGLLLAREFAGQGCKIAICGRDEQELERARQDLQQRDAEVLAARCDITQQAEVERLIEEVTQRFGQIDVLVNNAGIIQVGPLQSMTVRDFEDAMAVMFWGVLYPTLAVLPQMRERRSGRIVNITSIGGKLSPPHLLPYNCSKFAAVGLSEGLRAELAGTGISVTTIAPGLMRTGSHLNAFFKGRQKGEFGWFSLGASLPIVSMDAERAARQIVRSARRGDAEKVLSAPATLAARFHGLFPGLTADLLGIGNRILLPSSIDATRRSTGKQVERRIGSRMLDTVTSLGRSAAHRFNE